MSSHTVPHFIRLTPHGMKRRPKGEKANKKRFGSFAHRLQLPLHGLVAICSFLPLGGVIPLSSSRGHCAVLSVHRQLQVQQVEGCAAAGLEEGRRRPAAASSSSSQLGRRGARLALQHGGHRGLQGRREVERRGQVVCLKGKVVLRVELVLNTEGRRRREGDRSWIGRLTEGLQLGGEATGHCVVHWLWRRQPRGHRRVGQGQH